MSGCAQLGKKCDKCGNDNWVCIDKNEVYIEFCGKCGNHFEIKKVDYLRDFQCKECNCLEGKIEENDKLLAVRCKNCGKQVIMLEKHTTDNQRDANSTPSTPKTFEEIRKQESNIPKCPTCGSTNIEKISLGKKAVGASLFGLFSSNIRNTMHCKNCGTKW